VVVVPVVVTPVVVAGVTTSVAPVVRTGVTSETPTVTSVTEVDTGAVTVVGGTTTVVASESPCGTEGCSETSTPPQATRKSVISTFFILFSFVLLNARNTPGQSLCQNSFIFAKTYYQKILKYSFTIS
jgi:hypothetical protein